MAASLRRPDDQPGQTLAQQVAGLQQGITGLSSLMVQQWTSANGSIGNLQSQINQLKAPDRSPAWQKAFSFWLDGEIGNFVASVLKIEIDGVSLLGVKLFTLPGAKQLAERLEHTRLSIEGRQRDLGLDLESRIKMLNQALSGHSTRLRRVENGLASQSGGSSRESGGTGRKAARRQTASRTEQEVLKLNRAVDETNAAMTRLVGRIRTVEEALR